MKRSLTLALFWASGICALLYEVVWTRALALHLGATAPSLAAVLSSFMAGLAIGNALASRRRANNPLRTYGLLELSIALASLAVFAIINLTDPLLQASYSPTGPTAIFGLLRIGIPCLAMLPPTILMGATLPVLADHLTKAGQSAGTEIARAYALNTLGAMLGAFLAGFVAVPQLGMRATFGAAMALNTAIGIAAVVLSRTHAPSGPAAEPVAPSADRRSRILVLGGFAGFTSLGCELLWTRYFLNTFFSTVAAFSTVLIVWLGSIALGAAIASSLNQRGLVSQTVVGWLQLAIATCQLMMLGLLASLPGWNWQLSASLGSHGYARTLLVVLLLLVPTTLMGMVLPCCMHLLRGSAARPSAIVGRLYAANTVGSALGPAVAVFLLLPTIGLTRALLLLGALQAVIGLACLDWKTVANRGRLAGAGALVLLFVALAALQRPRSLLPLELVSDPDSVLFYSESGHGTVVVSENDQTRERWLFIDGFLATSDDLTTAYMRFMGHLPMLARRSAGGRALVICLGTGITVHSVWLNGPSQLDVAELNPQVPPASRFFSHRNEGVIDRPTTRLVVDDGRNYLNRAGARFDAITLEPLPPHFVGTVSLYTREFNEVVKAHLAPGGMFAQWLPMHLVSDRDARMIVKAVADVFPFVAVWRKPGDLSAIILASDQPIAFDAWPPPPRAQEELAALGIRSTEHLRRGLELEQPHVKAYVAGVQALTDDFPSVEYRGFENEVLGTREIAHTNINALRVAGGLEPLQGNDL